MIEMMIKFKYTPLVLGTIFLVGLYKRVDAKWKWALFIEKKIREKILAHIMLYLGKNHMSIALKDFFKKFMLRDRMYKVLKNKAHKVEQDSN